MVYQQTWQGGGSLEAWDLPCRITVLWPTFGAEPDTKIIYTSAILFPEDFSKTVGRRTTKLNTGGSVGASDVPFWVTVLWCRSVGQNYFMLTCVLLELFLKNAGFLKPKWTRVILRGPWCAFLGATVLWPNLVQHGRLKSLLCLHLCFLNRFQIQYTFAPLMEICRPVTFEGDIGYNNKPLSYIWWLFSSQMMVNKL